MKKIFKFTFIMTIIASTTAFAQNDNPLLQEWNTPHQTPPFSKIKTEHYEPAMEQAIAEAEQNIERIVNTKATPTFENTIVALEQASEKMERISGLLFNLNECNTSPEMQEVVMRLSPRMTQFANSVSMNEKLFARVKAVYDNRSALKLNTEQSTLLENTYNSFIRNGVGLKGVEKEQYKRNSEDLSQLTVLFGQHVLADNNDFFMHITNEADLEGLPENAKAAAQEEAQARKLDGWVITLDYPSFGPFLTYAKNRKLREKLWRAYNSQGNRNNKNDNNDLIRKITLLRKEQAKLLGYDSYCDYVLSDRMVLSTKNLKEFMDNLLKAAIGPAEKDVDAVRERAAREGVDLQRWDFSYYSEKLKQEQYQFDEELLRPYFQLDKVRQGIFDLYGRLYGLRFVEASNIETYHPDAKAYEIFDGKRFMGVLYLDMHPRASKRSGAWMTEFRGQSNINGHEVRPLIQVVCNFSKPIGDQPALLSFDEVETFMHEMGHAMHGMLSDCTYPSTGGTNVKRDFVELPSQVMENWCMEPEFLNTFAKHYQTGDTIPGEYIKKLKAAEKYLAGYLCVRQISLGLVDIAFHSIEDPINVPIEDFEHKYMVELLPVIKGCNTSTAFTHIFSGGYAAGYYGYKWAEVLDADVFSKFKKEGIFNKNTAKKFRQELLSKGGTEHPSVLFRNFMGREPDIDALMIRSGFKK